MIRTIDAAVIKSAIFLVACLGALQRAFIVPARLRTGDPAQCPQYPGRGNPARCYDRRRGWRRLL
jgi:hypothetical protein